jgi:antitoxin component of MazEF toxin-antitoxin module
MTTDISTFIGFGFNRILGYSFKRSKLQSFDISSPIVDLCYNRLLNKMTYQHNRINNPNNRRNPLQFEVRTVQLNGTSLTMTIPSLYADILGIHAGDIIKIAVNKDTRKLIAQKVELDFEEDDILRAA